MNYTLTFVQNGRLKLTFIIAKVSILEVRDKNETKIDELNPRLYTLVGAKGALSLSCLLVKVVKTTLSI